MTVRDPSTTSGPALGRGRLDKRQAIVDAALLVFAREGYSQASIEAIAAAAGVAKPTIYNHLGGKENLFRHVLAEVAARSNRKTMAALAAFTDEPADLRAELLTVARGLVDCFLDEQSAALRRLLHAEITRFPDLFDSVLASGPDQVNEALTGRLARLSNAGHLRIDDPLMAASQFFALISCDLPALSALGTRPVADADVDRVVTSGVDAFLRAFAA
jgi:TetR/AcrR family transcriptional repressor of mexJK operon